MRKTLDDMGLDKHIPVGNSDAGSFFATDVLENVEYGVRTFTFIYTVKDTF